MNAERVHTSVLELVVNFVVHEHWVADVVNQFCDPDRSKARGLDH